MSLLNSEWLVTDPKGAFAMGTLAGIRTRKYHGFFMGIPGRSETAFLADLDFECQGVSLWPHAYGGPEGPIIYPDSEGSSAGMQGKITHEGPEWQWTLPGGKLHFRVRAAFPSGIILNWKWISKAKNKTVALRVRGLWAMRDLHSLGGSLWTWQMNPGQGIATISVPGKPEKDVYCHFLKTWTWKEDPQWYQNFHYSEELERGYPSDENLYSLGALEIQLSPGQSEDWVIGLDPNDLNGANHLPQKNLSSHHVRPKLADFILTRPAGIVAGYPWFGEWGRDTFVSLPGIVASLLHAGEAPGQVESWSYELLHRWGSWLGRSGMLPNLLLENGPNQWDSADATLWWCHSLASLWSQSLCPPYPFQELSHEFSKLLSQAIASIREGRHLHLKENSDGLLEVTSPHTTWMDARVNGVPVTPRSGLLPEINALWFQALCLEWLWSGHESRLDLESLGKKVLQCREPDRPNTIFLHSLPLAPTFVFPDRATLEKDLFDIAEKFWTPVGLRTLHAGHPGFKPRCLGEQCERDQAYHQGPVWAWLGGHFEIAKHRLTRSSSGFDKMFPPGVLKDMLIDGHIPEIFDAEPPFTPRGAPAQAWSEACLEESRARSRLKVDSKLSKVLAQRWLDRKERTSTLARKSQEMRRGKSS